jgi:hypothetical protein
VTPGWDDLRRGWDDARLRDDLYRDFRRGRLSFVPHLLPELAVAEPTGRILDVLAERLGDALDHALDPVHADPGARLPETLRSPVADQPDGSWLTRSNVVGVNIRTLGSVWDVIKYSLTLPACFDAIHLLPVWQPGVVESLYGPSSWDIDRSIFSAELAAARPGLDTPERQLRAVIHLLHALGRTVGMDVIPHCDRYAEMALTHPEHFEWLQRHGLEIVDHRADLHVQVQRHIHEFVLDRGPAVPDETLPGRAEELFALPERTRRHLLFGRAAALESREARRLALVKWLRAGGFEPVPATMAPPYRGLEVDPDPDAEIVDEHGMRWRDYRITEPQEMSRVFGPLARYKLYERLDDNTQWAIDFDRPREDTWRYVCAHYADMQQRFGFDFMRGDMSHVQMRPGGVPAQTDERYDPLHAVKEHVRRSGAPWFAYFAESFLGPPDLMGYGDEVAHLEACDADATLGNLQSFPVGTPEFLAELAHYLDVAATSDVAPSMTAMTADKDDPRFDAFFAAGNAARTMLALFLPDLPSYTGLGFEIRDIHLRPAPNEHYTKLYVFHERQGPKARHGPWIWGRNAALFDQMTRLRLLAEEIGPALAGRTTRWLMPPDPAGANPVLAWTQAGASPRYVFVVNTAADRDAADGILVDLQTPTARLVHTTCTGNEFELQRLAADECRVYRVEE